ncbi:MAG: glycosyltransferase family 2 protein [Clostridiales bacterium]|nr:glycosyltransferase family 2 protein [Clostridiales bacterium]
MKKLVSVIAPMYNEEKMVHVYCEETIKVLSQLSDRYDFELVLVNDGSKDNTYPIMLSEQAEHSDIVTTVCLSRNFGLEGAVNAGLRKAAGDAVVVMDADLQDPPSLIPEMIAKWEQGADVVVGSRVSRRSDSFFKKSTAGLYYGIMNSYSGRLKLEKNAANFRLLSRKAVDQILAMPEVNQVFRVSVPFVGMKTEVIEYDRDKRYAGKTKYGLRSMISYALDSITGISVEPLRKISVFLPVTLLMFIGSIVGIFLAPPEWTAACVVIMTACLLTGFILVSLAVMAEYIAQIMIEAKGRPTSVIYEYEPCRNVKERQ